MRITRAGLVAVALTLLVRCANAAWAEHPVPPASGIWQSSSPDYALSASAQRRLIVSLKRITGIERIGFDTDGRLELGEVAGEHHGSLVAQRILREAQASGDIFVLEEYSKSPAVNFAQIEGMDTVNDTTHRHDRVWWIRIDFDDFQEMIASSPRVRETFDEGFVFLHELLHARGCHDPGRSGSAELGECETIVNQVRTEMRLPLRADYFATPTERGPLGTIIAQLRFWDNAGARGDSEGQEQPPTLSLSYRVRDSRQATGAGEGF